MPRHFSGRIQMINHTGYANDEHFIIEGIPGVCDWEYSLPSSCPEDVLVCVASEIGIDMEAVVLSWTRNNPR